MENIKKKIFKDINDFSIPLIFNSLFSIVISTIMTSIIGRISVNAIISTQVVDTLNYAVVGIIGVGTLVFNIESSRIRLVNEKDFYDWFKSCYIINFIIGLIAVIATFILAKPIFFKIYELRLENLDITSKYAYITSFSILANMMIFSMSNLLKVNKKTKEIFITGTIGSIIQVLLSYIFVYKILQGNYKVLGVAISSVIAIFLQLSIFVILLKDDIIKSFDIRSSKKRELILKSIPLMLQEILEGSVFLVLIITLITRLGNDIISSYSISMRIVAICLIPMYMYCNALTVLVGEYESKKEYLKVKLLPVMTTIITIFIYIFIGIISYIFRDYVIKFLTNIDGVIEGTSEILMMVLFYSMFQIFFENSKYALQSLGGSKRALKMTAFINTIVSIVLIFLSTIKVLNLNILLLILSINYIVLALYFYKMYNKKINLSINGDK